MPSLVGDTGRPGRSPTAAVPRMLCREVADVHRGRTARGASRRGQGCRWHDGECEASPNAQPGTDRLLEPIASWGNLLRAWEAVRRRGGPPQEIEGSEAPVGAGS